MNPEKVKELKERAEELEWRIECENDDLEEWNMEWEENGEEEKLKEGEREIGIRRYQEVGI